MKKIYTLKNEDVGKTQLNLEVCKCCGRTEQFDLKDSIGLVQAQDVGNSLYLSKNNHIYMGIPKRKEVTT